MGLVSVSWLSAALLIKLGSIQIDCYIYGVWKMLLLLVLKKRNKCKMKMNLKQLLEVEN